MPVSANLRNYPQNFHNNCADKCQNPGSRNSLDEPVALCVERGDVLAQRAELLLGRGLLVGGLPEQGLREYLNTDTSSVFHGNLQEACFVLIAISENLRKPPGVYGIM